MNTKLQVKSSGQYLNILNGGPANGTFACQGNTPTTNNFLWEIEAPDSDGWSLIQVKSSGQYLNILDGGNRNGKVACQGNRPTTPNFLWKIVEGAAGVPDGWFLLQVKSSGQYLNILNGGNSNGKVACQGNTPTTTNFFWQKVSAQSKPLTINLQIDCPSLIASQPNGGLISDADANKDLVFDDKVTGHAVNGNESSFESIVNPGSTVTWTATTKSGNNSEYSVSIDSIVYEIGTGTGNIFSSPTLESEPGNSGKVVAEVLWTAMEPVSGANESYTVHFTITPKGGNPVKYWVDPKLRVNPKP